MAMAAARLTAPVRRAPARRRRRPVVIAWSAATLATAEIAATLSFGPGEGWSFLPLAISLAVVGTLLSTRLPHHPIGWLLLAWSVITGYGALVNTWGLDAVAAHRVGTVLPWAGELLVIVWHPGFWLFVMVCLVFPDGRFMSVRWRRLAVLITCWYVALAIASVLAPDVVSSYVPGVPPPYVSPVQSVADGAFGFLLASQLGWLVVGAGALVVRWRRTQGDDRRQVTVFAFPTAVALVVFVLTVIIVGDGEDGFLVFPVLPVTIGVAVLRYKLYAIDRIVSRTVSYGIVTAVVAGVYVGSVQLVGLAVPESDSVAVAVATLVVAVVFAPLRRRVQRVVDRRFNRERYDRERLVDGFRRSLRHPESTHVEAELVDLVQLALHPSTCSVWVQSFGGGYGI